MHCILRGFFFFSCSESEKDADLNLTFPQTQYVTMPNADTNKILGKLKEFNENAPGDGLRLGDIQLQQINELVNGNYDNLEEKIILVTQLLKWPVGKAFIAICFM